MKIVFTKKVLSAIERYADATTPIAVLFQMLKDNDYASLEELRKGYSRHVNEVYGYTIFNIKGNQYRLIVTINYKKGIIDIKKFLTHAEYDKINWNNQK
ncbi:type II toxin-antitoxin system HigB family toxin [Microcoleus sp. B6-A1]|uniref:type II toxin-antitoxin system HigB family toxin n=1 Tax=Microcoleus sp. B6-A1 TaxID=2818684 RepID=UPI002FD37BB5